MSEKQVIWKFMIPIEANAFTIKMPTKSRILTVHEQHGQIYMWVLISDTNDPQIRVFDVFGTGHPISEGSREYCGTAFVGSFVWHVFERIA